jgi:hypothetical protein
MVPRAAPGAEQVSPASPLPGPHRQICRTHTHLLDTPGPPPASDCRPPPALRLIACPAPPAHPPTAPPGAHAHPAAAPPTPDAPPTVAPAHNRLPHTPHRTPASTHRQPTARRLTGRTRCPRAARGLIACLTPTQPHPAVPPHTRPACLTAAPTPPSAPIVPAIASTRCPLTERDLIACTRHQPTARGLIA